MVEDRNPGLTLERGKIAGAEQARDRHQLAAARAVQMVVMRVAELEARAAVFQDELADFARCGELLGGAEDRREICRDVALAERGVQIFERPGVVMALAHQRQDRGGNDRGACHGAAPYRRCQHYASSLRNYIFMLAGGQVPSTATTARMARPIACSANTERASVRSGTIATSARDSRGIRRNRLVSARPIIVRNSAILTARSRPYGVVTNASKLATSIMLFTVPVIASSATAM